MFDQSNGVGSPGWTILRTKPIAFEVSDFWSDSVIRGVLSIEENEFGGQRARITDGSRSWKRDVAWTWGQMEE